MSDRDDRTQGIGESLTRRGEDVVDGVAQDSDREGTVNQDQSGRPTGDESVEDLIGIDPHERLDEENPALRPQ